MERTNLHRASGTLGAAAIFVAASWLPAFAHAQTSDAQPQPLQQQAAPQTTAPQYGQPITGQVVQPMQVTIIEPPKPKRYNRISFGPVGLLLGIGNFTYERVITDHFSLEVSPTFLYWGWGSGSLVGGGLGLGAAFYLNGTAPEGLRFSASVGPGFLKSEGDPSTFIFISKALFGYQWVWRNGFSMGLAGGLQYIHASNSDEGYDVAINGILPAIDFNLGFAF